MIEKNVLNLIGNTPVVRVGSIVLNNNLFAKLEYFNPFSSVKDRTAYYLIKGMKEKGKIKTGTMIIEPTSGNTGIALAAISSIMNLECTIVMPESMSEERKALIKGFGAKLVLTDAEEGMAGAIKEAERINRENPNSVIADQFNNEDNIRAHYETTGPEILRDLENIDYFVAAFGTGGTISGVGRYLKENKKDVKIIAVEPKESPLLSKGYAAPHKIQGIGANFVPSILDRSIIDEVRLCSSSDAINTSKYVMRKEGLFCGISSGAALCVAAEIANEHKDKTVLALLPDTAERYLSSDLFAE